MLAHQFASAVKPSRVVLLGANGFIALRLQRVLQDSGIPARAVGSREVDLTGGEAAGLLASLLQPEDCVVMASALTPDKGRDIATMMKNLRMAENVCAAIGEAKPAHFVYIGSDAVYDGRSSSLINEDSSREPSDLYALAHVGREKMLEQCCAAATIPLAIVRPCAVYGPGDTHNSYGPNRFIRTATETGKITLFGHGEERRHHVYINDVARILQLCVQHRSSGTINAVTGQAVSFGEAAEMVAAAVARPVTIEFRPRASPITHRHFDLSASIKAFPDFAATSLSAGISQSMVNL
jgi:nucleoside-diphosphate-sugar epimerase